MQFHRQFFSTHFRSNTKALLQ